MDVHIPRNHRKLSGKPFSCRLNQPSRRKDTLIRGDAVKNAFREAPEGSF